MADLNTQQKLGSEQQAEIAVEIKKRRRKERIKAKTIKVGGHILHTAGSLGQKVGKGMGWKKLAEKGSKYKAIGAEAKAIGAEAQKSGYIKETVKQRNAARNVDTDFLPAGAPMSSVASPLKISEDEQIAEALKKLKRDAGKGEEGKEEPEGEGGEEPEGEGEEEPEGEGEEGPEGEGEEEPEGEGEEEKPEGEGDEEKDGATRNKDDQEKQGEESEGGGDKKEGEEEGKNGKDKKEKEGEEPGKDGKDKKEGEGKEKDDKDKKEKEGEELADKKVPPEKEGATKRELAGEKNGKKQADGENKEAEEGGKKADNKVPPEKEGATKREVAGGKKEDADMKKAAEGAEAKAKANKPGEDASKEGAKGPPVSIKAQADMWTAKALKYAWLNIIDSYGSTILYLNFHFVMRYVASITYFCRFGKEVTSSPGSQAMQAAGKKESKAEETTNAAIEYAEIIALIFIDIVIAAAIALIIILIYMIIVSNPIVQIYTAITS